MRVTRILVTFGLVLGLGLVPACGGGGGGDDGGGGGGGGGGGPAVQAPTTPNPHPVGSKFSITHPVNSVTISIESLKAGDGAAVQKAMEVAVHLDMRVQGKGEVFKTTRGGDPLLGVAGFGVSIPGVDLAVQSMRVGDLWRVTIPAELAFGDHGGPKVPAKSTVEAEVELVKIVE